MWNVSHFRPQINISELKDDRLKQLMDLWLQVVATDTKHQLKAVFDIVTTVKTIHSIKMEAFAIREYIFLSSAN